jgi:hypothetical protein
MIAPQCYRRCVHALTWRVSVDGRVFVLCELEHDEVTDQVCEFCWEYET